jgi:hypothetical protein
MKRALGRLLIFTALLGTMAFGFEPAAHAMTVSIWPETHGDVILDLRYRRNEDGNMVPALVAVDAEGKELSFGRIVEVRDGGGHVELFRVLMSSTIGFDRDGEVVKIHPE